MTEGLAGFRVLDFSEQIAGPYCSKLRVNGGDVEDLLAQRGIEVSYESIRRWCVKFGPAYAARPKRRQPRLGDTFCGLPTPVCSAIERLRSGQG